jgi:hypothetical protein
MFLLRYARDSSTFGYLQPESALTGLLAFVGFRGVTVTSAGKVLGKAESFHDPYVKTLRTHIR